jgi:hypothetical protein
MIITRSSTRTRPIQDSALVILRQKTIRLNARSNSDNQDEIRSSNSDSFDERKRGDDVENLQTFDFLAPILAAVARLRAWVRADRAADTTDLAEHPAVEAAPDHRRSPAFEAIRIVCEHSAPPGA